MGPSYDVDGILEPWKYAMPQLAAGDDESSSEEGLGEREWHALAELIAELPGLCELTWSCLAQVPFSILEIHHSRMPHFRLHMPFFTSFSLH